MSDDKYQRVSERFFQVSPLYTRPGWYIKLREGDVLGPFANRRSAQSALFTLLGIADTDNEFISQTADATVPYSSDSRK